MLILRNVADVRAALREARRAERSIGLVPTMGALHAGHLSLIAAARTSCDVVVVSLFVNPAQFNDADDLSAYPRSEERDATLLAAQGVDILFAPGVDVVYPPGFATTVTVGGVTETLEGAARGREHFDGVATVVAKLFNMVGPDVAFFGQKDAQQALVIRRLVADLDIAVRVEVCPTVREDDGLAMSSRNVHLNPGDRRRATALQRALARAQEAVQAGEQDAATLRGLARNELAQAGITPEYVELVSPETLTPVTRVDRDTLAVIAARVGTTRLIDNQLLRVATSADRPAAGVTGEPECNARC